jgi:hypothetical protein
MAISEPDPQLEAKVKLAFLDLMSRTAKAFTPAARRRFRSDLESKWLPREDEAFRVSMATVGLVAAIVEEHNSRQRAGGGSLVSDQQFSAALVLEYLALAEGVFKYQLKLIAFIASVAGLLVPIRGKMVRVLSSSDLERPDLSVEELAQCARLYGFGPSMAGVFDNRLRRSIAHFDLDIAPDGTIRFFYTRKDGKRVRAAEVEVEDMQRMNWRLRDFCHSFSKALSDHAMAEFLGSRIQSAPSKLRKFGHQ